VFGDGFLDGVHDCVLRVKSHTGPKPNRYFSLVVKRASPAVCSVPSGP
jgi:hypothetical protein